MDFDEAAPARRLRFSLLTLLLLTAIVALSLTVVMLYRELRPLRTEVVKLRIEASALNIDDPTMLHIRSVETHDNLKWKWRIWIPEGARYTVRSRGGGIPKAGFPDPGSMVPLITSGECVVSYVIRRDRRYGGWYGELQTPSGSVGGDKQSWVDWTSRFTAYSGPGLRTQAYPTGQPVDLTRHRVSKMKSSQDFEDPSDGFMVWLEPY